MQCDAMLWNCTILVLSRLDVSAFGETQMDRKIDKQIAKWMDGWMDG